MKLKNLNFSGYVFGQSGVQGFFGEGDEYPHHAFYRNIPSFSFYGMIFVAKTVTLIPRIYPESSNTELKEGYKVKNLFPSSIWCSAKSFFNGYLLNAVGLANPGIRQILAYKKWQKRSDVFQISVMLGETDIWLRIIEAQEICYLLKKEMPLGEKHQYALQINFSCPNTGHEQKQDAENIIDVLKLFRREFPSMVLIPKFDLLVEPQTIVALSSYCDAFCISNTLPFSKKQDKKWWQELFKDGKSPLTRHFNGKFPGGLSGAPLFPLLLDWLTIMRDLNPTIKIIAGGGIMTRMDIWKLSQFPNVCGIALGSVAILRPWRLRGLIEFGNKIFSQKAKITNKNKLRI